MTLDCRRANGLEPSRKHFGQALWTAKEVPSCNNTCLNAPRDAVFICWPIRKAIARSTSAFMNRANDALRNWL